MSTLIKRNGTWVKVSGHTMWMGTKSQLSAALEAGELPDGTEIMITDDFTATEEYIRRQLALSDFEEVTPAGFDVENAITTEYDGFLSINNVGTGNNAFYIKKVGTDNYKLFTLTSSVTACAACIPVNKGDMLYVTGTHKGTWNVSYYKERDYTGR